MFNRKIRRSLTLIVHEVGIGSLLQQDLDGWQIAFTNGVEQWCLSVSVGVIDFTALLD